VRTRKAKLRLDVRDLAIARRDDDVTPIVPGKPEASEVIARARHEQGQRRAGAAARARDRMTAPLPFSRLACEAPFLKVRTVSASQARRLNEQ
jgi:hypothetical protein